VMKQAVDFAGAIGAGIVKVDNAAAIAIKDVAQVTTPWS
jgi:hypothetical protein